MTDKRYLTARAAAGQLGISVPTLYAYASRGMLRSEAVPGKTRERRYFKEDVDRLKERKELRRAPEQAGRRSLHWGSPVVESGITLIEGGRLYYRGRDVEALARSATVEEVAALLWTGDSRNADGLFAPSNRLDFRRFVRVLAAAGEIEPVPRCQLLLPVASGMDPAAFNLRREPVALAGARILTLLAFALANGPGSATGPSSSDSIDAWIQRGWIPGNHSARPLIRAAMILCADHELNVSTFTSRCVASAGSNPYDVVAAGLAAMKGNRHGGMTAQVQSLLQEVRTPERAAQVVADRLSRGQSLPGFGHPLYPEGDPRGALLISMAKSASRRRVTETAEALAESVVRLTGSHPTSDFGLVVASEALGLPAGAPLALFALGRTIGWIAHAIEQYESNELIRPRARYIGLPPERPE